MLGFLFSLIAGKGFDWTITNWNKFHKDQKARKAIYEKLINKYGTKITEIELKDVIGNFYLQKEDFNQFNSTSQINDLNDGLRNILRKRSDVWKENRNENVIDGIIDDYLIEVSDYFRRNDTSIAILFLDSRVNKIEQSLYNESQLRILSSLSEHLSNIPSQDPIKFLIENNLFFFPENEINILSKLEDTLSAKSQKKIALIVGEPDCGKSILSIKAGFNFFNNGYKVFYVRLDFRPDRNMLWMDLCSLRDENKVLVIMDNCHLNISDVSYICQNYDKVNNISFLFVSRPIQKELATISEYDNFNFYDLFESSRFDLSSKHFEEKAIGIIERYKDYYENYFGGKMEIGNQKFAINNAHNSLITLYYNLEFWQHGTTLDNLSEGKNKVLNKVYQKYLEKDFSGFLLKVAALSKYEIYYEAKENELTQLEDYARNGVLRQHPNSNYYYLYHSTFAKLLLNSFSIHSSFMRYNSIDEFVFIRITDYIRSFPDYPLNLENIFLNLINNHAQSIAIKLLKDDFIFSQFIKYNENHCYAFDLLFILYRIQKNDYSLGRKLFENISTEIWVNNFRKKSIAGLSIGLTRLKVTASKKCSEVLNSFSLEELIEKSRQAEFRLLPNSLRELNQASGQLYLGTKIYATLTLAELIKKIAESTLTHIGKGISELFNVDKRKTIELFNTINSQLLCEKIKCADIKSISKSLNELNKIVIKSQSEPNKISNDYITNLLKSIEDDTLVLKLKSIGIEGIGRSLNEFYKIDKAKTKSLFEKLSNDFLINLLSETSLEQIAHSLSELFSINEDKVKALFYLLDVHVVIKKINNENTTLQKIGNALSVFRKVDESKSRTNELIKMISPQLLIKKTRSISFNNICIGLKNISVSSLQLAQDILNGIEKDHLITKAQNEDLENLGRSFTKLSCINSDLADNIALLLDWNKILTKSENISFSQFANCLADLKESNKGLAKNIYKSFNIDLLVSMAIKSNNIEIRDSLRKLKNIDKKKSRKVFNLLKISLVNKIQYQERDL